MPRVYKSYDLDSHAQGNTGAGNSVTTLTAPAGANAVLLSARTANAYVVWDGSTPSATNGLEIIAGAQPVLIPIGNTIKFIGAAVNTILNAVWLE